MSTNNTIRLNSVEGDKYISAQNTLVYKGVTLFGYGYLDWGTVVNQSIINLMDAIDKLQDSGLSEIQFDLTEYEEEQKRLRAEEFNTWKTGFKSMLQDLIASYVNESKVLITEFTTLQTKINTDTTAKIEENFNLLDEEVKTIMDGLDERVQSLTQEQISALNTSVNKLTSLVNEASDQLIAATDNANKVLTEVQQLISNFKVEFNKTFETFKNETTEAINTDKEYLIKYIDSLIGKSTLTTNNLDERLTSLELISDSLNPETVKTIITSKVNEITAGIITSYLESYQDTLDTLDDKVNNFDKNLENIVKQKIDIAMIDTDNSIKSIQNSILSMSKSLLEINTNIGPLQEMRRDFLHKFDSIPIVVDTILDQAHISANLLINSESISKDHAVLSKNILEGILTQEIKNNERMVAFINANLLNLMEGLGNSSFNELSLIKRSSLKDNLFNNLAGNIQSNISSYMGTDFKLLYFGADYEYDKVMFAFKLPNAYNELWKTYGVRFTNTTTHELYESEFQVIGSNITLQNPTKIGSEFISETVDENISYFSYNNLSNCTTNIEVKFLNGISGGDNFKLDIFDITTSTDILSLTIPFDYASYLDADADFRNTIFPNFFAIDKNITKPTALVQNINWENGSTHIVVPVWEIQTKQDGTKELALKVRLPNGATLTNIVFNDGTGTVTKTFTNIDEFPLTEAEYNSRSLANTNNYYKDICSTGIILFPIDTNSKKVIGTINYKIGTTDKTFDVSTSKNGGSETRIVNSVIGIGSYAEFDVTILFDTSTISSNVFVEPRVQETNSTSELYGKFIKGDNLCSIVWMDNKVIRIYNEYTTSLTFQFAFKN